MITHINILTLGAIIHYGHIKSQMSMHSVNYLNQFVSQIDPIRFRGIAYPSPPPPQTRPVECVGK